jgi:hypothetical protein
VPPPAALFDLLTVSGFPSAAVCCLPPPPQRAEPETPAFRLAGWFRPHYAYNYVLLALQTKNILHLAVLFYKYYESRRIVYDTAAGPVLYATTRDASHVNVVGIVPSFHSSTITLESLSQAIHHWLWTGDTCCSWCRRSQIGC